MYNDYYLQQIDNKLAINNNLLDDIIENQATIEQYIESGDRAILYQVERTNTDIIMLIIIMMTLLIFQFIIRCLR